MTRSRTRYHRSANGVPVERDHVERSAALRQWTFVTHQRGLHVHFKLAVDQLGDGQEFDDIAQFIRILEVGQFQRVDPLPRERGER